MNRRHFLSAAAATPFLFGLSDLLGQDEKPGWLRDALKRMKNTGRCGIVLVTPDTNEKRRALGLQLLARYEDKTYPVREFFFETVVVCVSSAEADRRFRKKGEKFNRILLDPDGKRISADEIESKIFQGAESFAKSFSDFLHGAEEKHLISTVGKLKKSLADADRARASKAMDDLDTEDDVAKGPAETLRGMADRIAPWLVFARKDAVFVQGRDRIRGVIESALERRLPYGTRINLAVPAPGGDPCPRCGMARVAPQAKRFLEFLNG